MFLDLVGNFEKKKSQVLRLILHTCISLCTVYFTGGPFAITLLVRKVVVQTPARVALSLASPIVFVLANAQAGYFQGNISAWVCNHG